VLYSKKAGFKVTCHQPRHTMATQMLNADADLVTIQDILGHSYIRSTERYCHVSNQKVRRIYYRAIDKVIERHSPPGKKSLTKKRF
jgi:site-specific recombinase XerD